jgi:(1->4)-alpha-D-glucan 1-alpha-D-glucosylmutase
VPSANDEYLLYQTLVGAWPIGGDSSVSRERFVQRICEYMIKALREGKERTSWTNPNQAYEHGVSRFVQSILRTDEFLADFVAFQKKTSYFGVWNSLAQMLIRLTAPGVPDVYQGNEMWEFNLVDPDNRRAIDYGARHRALQQIVEMGSDSQLSSVAEKLAMHPEDGCIKMYLLWQSLQLRKRLPDIFNEGVYVPLNVIGAKSKHVVAFMRRLDKSSIVVTAPRLCSQLTRGEMRLPLGEAIWGDCELQLPDEHSASYRDAFTGMKQHCREGVLRIADLFGRLPFALLTSEPHN